MRTAVSYLLILLGIYLLTHAAYQEFTGDTVRPYQYLPFTRRAILARRNPNPYYQFRIHVLKQNNPELFREFMTAHWVWAVLIAGIGVYLNATGYVPPATEPETPSETPAQ